MTIFQSPEAAERIAGWYERFRAKIPATTESRTVATSRGDSHVLVGGPPGAPPLVIAHGALASSAHALVELAGLLAQFRVYAVDVLGQSVKTPHARPSVTNNEYGAWLAEVLDGLGVGRAHLLGISWGGFVATRFAIVAPERIDRLALLVPAGIVGGSAWQGFTKLGWPLLMYRMFPSEARFAKFAASLLTTPDDDWQPYLRDAFTSYKFDMRVPRLATPDELATFARPTLVLAAEHDVSFPGAKLLARAGELFRGPLETELLAGSKHCPPTTPAFRTYLAARITRFYASAAVAATA